MCASAAPQEGRYFYLSITLVQSVEFHQKTPLVFRSSKTRGAFWDFGHVSRLPARFYYPFLMNFSYILHVFDARNDSFSSCVSNFSRLRRTFLSKTFSLQAREGATIQCFFCSRLRGAFLLKICIFASDRRRRCSLYLFIFCAYGTLFF